MFSRAIHLVALFALFAGACGSTSSTPAEMDAAVVVDALALDSGVSEVGTPDAGSPEVGTPDAGAPDGAMDLLWPDYGSVTDAAAPSFTSLPPFDKIGTKWAYAYVEAGAKKTYKVEVTGKVLQAGGGYGYVHQQTFASPLVSSLHLFLLQGGKLALMQSQQGTSTVTYSPPLLRLSVPLVKGKIWTQQVTVGGGAGVFQRKVEVLGFETVTVTAGTFACSKLRLTNSTIGGTSVVVDEWWSEKVGLIKSTAHQDLQLVSFVQAP